MTRARQDASANRAKTDLRGFFAIQDLPSGSYVLEASFTGYSPVVLSGLEIAPGQEVQLREPILLAKPFDFEISLEPILDPSGSPWLVSVLARSARSGGLRETPAFQGEATDGVARVPVSVGDVLYIRVHNSARQRVRFVPGYTIADSSDRHLELEIDSIPVAGSVTVGDDPLRASLYFGGRSGAEMVELESDESGDFVGTLPKAGEWRVEVVAETAAISTWTSVSIPEKGTDDLEIELPRTRVSGTVVDAAGRPVPGAKVNLRTANASSAAKSQPAGEFDFRSFSAGPITLTARRSGPDGERSSAAVELSVAQDVAVEGVRLVLQENAPLRGRVVGPRGPVPGATLYVNVTHPLEFHNFGATGRTDELGVFEVELPAISSRAEVIVAAAGYALTAFEVDPRSEALLEVPIDGGELVLRTASKTPAAYGLVVYQDGLAISPALLDQWSQGQGAPPINPTAAIREMRVPHLAPGYYRSCVLDRAREMRRYVEEGAQTPDPIQCRDGFLHVGNILELDLTTN